MTHSTFGRWSLAIVVVLVAASPSVALGQGSIELLAPTGGEILVPGESFEIRWSSSGFAGDVDVEYSETGPADPFYDLAKSEPNDGSFDWYLDPALYFPSIYAIRVTSVNAPSISAISGAFSVVPLALRAPTGGEAIPQESTFEIRWSSSGFAGDVDIEYSGTGPGGPFELLAAGEPNDGSFEWYVDFALHSISSDCVIRVASVDEPSIEANSGVFEVIGPMPCGDGVVWGAEECDDGNMTPGDGCDASCEIESGWTCEGEPSVCTELPALVPSISFGGLAFLAGLVFAVAIAGLAAQRRRRAG